MASSLVVNIITSFLLLITASLMVFPAATKGIECGEVNRMLVPCRSYWFTPGPSIPTIECCAAAKKLEVISVSSAADRDGLCDCFKQTIVTLNINTTKSKMLPKLCQLTPCPCT
ncbi:non-specific lipid-transfer protein 1-like [Impatiens glandulifera]|uniref:non-specific lipid-transfer protein 1-like n=1 Tax=Impatiens glandulifera TaxID=253017 RepID=UPI001FB0BEBA|nr:non-specific lipid-transfer protein 1-like [Impatiens glandulifera]